MTKEHARQKLFAAVRALPKRSVSGQNYASRFVRRETWTFPDGRTITRVGDNCFPDTPAEVQTLLDRASELAEAEGRVLVENTTRRDEPDGSLRGAWGSYAVVPKEAAKYPACGGYLATLGAVGRAEHLGLEVIA